MQRLLATTLALAAACRLDPLVEDQPGASAHLLPPGASVPLVITNAELTNRLVQNDGLDSKALEASKNLIVRGTGASGGQTVHYWAFGKATRAPAPLYVFGTLNGTAFTPFKPGEHPQLPLADSIPGDYQYNPIHTIHHVPVTDRYKGELITTSAALADAIELGLVEPPIATNTFVCSPIVRPGLTLEVGGKPAVDPAKLFAHGHVMDMFQVGTKYGPRPNPFGLLAAKQVSRLREQQGAGYDATRPIFEATIPTSDKSSYTPLSVVVNVDLTGAASSINSDGDLFNRDANGLIMSTTSEVAQFAVTTTELVIQIQFTEGEL